MMKAFLCVACLVVILVIILPIATNEVLEEYTVGGQVNGIHYEGKYHNRPVIRVKGEGFAKAFSISNDQAARYCVGDIVVVKVQKTKNCYGTGIHYTFVG
jgi:hypothetical protein